MLIANGGSAGSLSTPKATDFKVVFDDGKIR